MRYFALFIAALSLIACNLTAGTGEIPIETTPTAITEQPTPEAAENVTYWQSFAINDVTPTDSDIVLFEQIVLRRMESDRVRSGIAETDLVQSLEAMLDSDNAFDAETVTIESAVVEGTHATVYLVGELRSAGGAQQSMARLQFQLTVFEEPTIDSFIMFLNGNNITNLGIAHESQALPEDTIFTREGLSGGVGFTP